MEQDISNNSLMSEGNKAFEAKDWPRAIECFEVLLKKNPDNTNVRNALGISLFNHAQSSVENEPHAFKMMRRGLKLAYNTAAEAEYNRLKLKHSTRTYNKCVELFNEGNLDEATQVAERVLEIEPKYKLARELIGMCWFQFGLQAGSKGDPDYALQCYANARRLIPLSTYVVQNMTRASAKLKKPAKLSYYSSLKEDELGDHIAFVCAPKCGSTFMYLALLEITGYINTLEPYPIHGMLGDLHPLQMEQLARENTISHRHIPASIAIINLFQAYKIKPVVLYRNIFDGIVSMADFYSKGIALNASFMYDFYHWDREKQLDATIDTYAKNAIEVYFSWKKACETGKLNAHFASYDEFLENKFMHMQKICNYCDIKVSDDTLTAVIEAQDNNKEVTHFNKGISGRGLKELSELQIARVRNMAGYFTGIDLSPIGL